MARKIKINLIIKTGNVEGDALTRDVCLMVLKGAFLPICGATTRVGIKNYGILSGGGDTVKPPDVRMGDITAYENDKTANLAEFKNDLETAGYTVAE
jgi:hypothetical protein